MELLVGLLLGRAGDDERAVLAADRACPGGASRLSVPLGPLTVTWRPSIVTSTPDGTVMGRRPIRDMSSRLPDEREDFAAELRLAGLLAGHDPLARADDDDAEAAEDARDVGLARVDAQAGLADPLEAGDDRAPCRRRT